MLTKKQFQLLVYIHEHSQHSDVAPSFDEMKEALGLNSKSGVHRLVTSLVERGFIKRLPYRARAIEILKLPEGLKKGQKNVISFKEKPAARKAAEPATSGFSEIPLAGKIAAGTPIEAIQHSGPSVAVPPDMMGRGEHYALTVDGDSMINAGIHHKDTVIIKKCDTAENGTIVVALVDGAEVTLKRLRRTGGKIVLEPENDSYKPQSFDPKRVKIQGKLVGLMRQYH